MKSSLKLVVVFQDLVGFEYIHSSFPDRKRSTEYPIFSEMKSSLKLMAVFDCSFDRPSTFWIDLVVTELAFVFELFDGVVVIELAFIFELFDRPLTFRVDLVIIELAFVFKLFEGVLVFELFLFLFLDKTASRKMLIS